MYDIAIVGSGPAGSALARLLNDRYRVALIEPRRLDLPAADDSRPPKLCGGLLAPAAQKELARQGLGVPSEVLDGPQLFAVRTVDVRAGLERLYQRHYVNIDRDLLDRWLASLVPQGVERLFGTSVVGVEPRGSETLLRLRTSSGAPASICARLVVGADGASSAIRRLAGGRCAAGARYVAVQGSFAASAAEPHYGALFDTALTDHYGWTIPKDGEVLAGIAMPEAAGAMHRFRRFVESARASGFDLGPMTGIASAPVLRPRGFGDVVFDCGGTVFLGEAAGLISPSSAEGISYALRSAAVLASVLDDGLERAGRRYRLAAAPLAFEVVMKVSKASLVGGTVSRRAAMLSGVGSIPRQGSGTVRAVLGELIAP